MPRVWTLVWGEMNGITFADELPSTYRAAYPDGECLRDDLLPERNIEAWNHARDDADACVKFLRDEISLLH